MTLDSLGKLQDFSDVFNLSVYRKNIFKYKCKQRLLGYFDPFAKDNIDLARKNGKYVPSLLLSAIVYSPLIIKKIINKFLNIDDHTY